MAENMFNYIQTCLYNLDYEDEEVTRALRAVYKRIYEGQVFSQDEGLAYAMDWLENQKGNDST